MEILTAAVCWLALCDGATCPPPPPPLGPHDLARFPSRAEAERQWEIAQNHAYWLRDRQALDWHDGGRNQDAWGDRYRDQERVCNLWDLLRRAYQHQEWYGHCEDWALRDLREQLGPAAWWAGVMPPPVPAWHLIE